MVIPLDQQPFGLHSKKKLLQNYEWFGSQPHYPGPVKFALALCNIAKYVAQWLFSNIYIVGSCEHFNFLIHQPIPDFIWAPSKDSFSKTI